jgi:hypothetical protein
MYNFASIDVLSVKEIVGYSGNFYYNLRVKDSNLGHRDVLIYEETIKLTDGLYRITPNGLIKL